MSVYRVGSEREEEQGICLAEVKYHGWKEQWSLKNYKAKGSWEGSLRDLKDSAAVSKAGRVGEVMRE